MPTSGPERDGKKKTHIYAENQKRSSAAETIPQQNPETKQSLVLSDKNIGSSCVNSVREENESSSLVDSEIRWEDLLLGEEIGQGIYS